MGEERWAGGPLWEAPRMWQWELRWDLAGPWLSALVSWFWVPEEEGGLPTRVLVAGSLSGMSS